jgi:hypothetical protein
MDKWGDKLKEGVSIREIEEFVRRRTTEVFFVLALAVGAISGAFDFFMGPGWAIAGFTLACLVAVFSPVPVEKGLKQLYSFLGKQEKTTEIILGLVQLVLALFVPFLYFGLLGLLAGTSFHYYIRHSHIVSENRALRSHRPSSGDEHD